MIGKTETLPIPIFAYLNGSLLMSKAGNRFRGREKNTYDINVKKSMSLFVGFKLFLHFGEILRDSCSFSAIF